MKGLIIINAYTDNPRDFNQPNRLKEEFAKLGVEIDIRRNDFFATRVTDGNLQGIEFNYDFCIYLDKDKYMSEMLEKMGVKIFNNHNAIRVCDDKMRTHIALSGLGIAMPKTLAGLLCYTDTAVVKAETIDRIEAELSYPIIVKICYGSLGKGVYKADNRGELVALAEKLKMTPHLFQEFIKESYGMDARVIVIGGKVFASMKRVSTVDFRSNIELGGKGEKYEINENEKEICEKTAQALGLDYCGIDLLFGKNQPIICEVNSNSFFGSMENITGKNVAKAYAEHIISVIRK